MTVNPYKHTSWIGRQSQQCAELERLPKWERIVQAERLMLPFYLTDCSNIAVESELDASSSPIRQKMQELDTGRGIAIFSVLFYRGFFWSLGAKTVSQRSLIKICH
jgi:hypothetical protein